MNFQDEEGNRSLAAELDALSDSFVFEPCDDDPRAVIPRVRWMYKELCKRQEPGFIVRAQDTIIGIMDEFNTVATGIDPNLTIVQHRQQPLNFGQTIALLEREGRKYGIHFMLIGHKWAQQDIGGDNAVRTNATTYICHKLNDQRQAETLLSGRDAKRMLELAVGEYLITGSAWNKPVTKITTPLISALDLPVLLQIKERGVQVRNQGNVIEATSMPDLPMKQSRATESLDEFTEEEAWGGEPSEESEDDPSIIPLRKSHVPPQVRLEDARAAYDKGAKTIDKLAAALKIEPWQARKLMSQIRWQNDQQQQSEAE